MTGGFSMKFHFNKVLCFRLIAVHTPPPRSINNTINYKVYFNSIRKCIKLSKTIMSQ